MLNSRNLSKKRKEREKKKKILERKGVVENTNNSQRSREGQKKKKKAEGCGGLPSSWRDGLPTKSGSSCAGLMGLACQKWSFVPRWPSVLFSVFQPARKSWNVGVIELGAKLMFLSHLGVYSALQLGPFVNSSLTASTAVAAAPTSTHPPTPPFPPAHDTSTQCNTSGEKKNVARALSLARAALPVSSRRLLDIN